MKFFIFGIWLFSLAVFAIPKPSFKENTKAIRLIHELASKEFLVQSEAMSELDQMGRDSIPYLLKYIQTTNESQRWRIWYLLAKRQRPEVIPFLKKGIEMELKQLETPRYLAIYFYSLAHFSGRDEILFILNHLPKDIRHYSEAILYKLAKNNPKEFLKGLKTTKRLNLGQLFSNQNLYKDN